MLTCSIPEVEDFPLFKAADGAHHCLLELTSPSAETRARVLDIIAQSGEEVSVLAQLPFQLILGNPSDPLAASPLCSVSFFGDLVDSAIFVPPEPIQPQTASHLVMMPDEQQAAGNPVVQSYLDQFTQQRVRDYLVWLSTDKSGGNAKITRNSYAIKTGSGGCADATWRCAHAVVDETIAEINKLMAGYPYPWRVEKLTFRADMCSNIRLVLDGLNSTNDVVVVGAHIDSRNVLSGTGATGAAPGADDNGSGSAVNLGIVQALATNPSKRRFTYSLHVAWFCGEEQGLLGSQAMAKEYKAAKVNVIAMLNADMIGYTDPKFGITLTFDARSVTPQLVDSCKLYSKIYFPSLKIGDTTGCCSDTQSFFNQGYPALGIFETPTSNVAYPQYHKAGDTWDNGLINFQQVHLFGAAFFSCALEFAL